MLSETLYVCHFAIAFENMISFTNSFSQTLVHCLWLLVDHDLGFKFGRDHPMSTIVDMSKGALRCVQNVLRNDTNKPWTGYTSPPRANVISNAPPAK